MKLVFYSGGSNQDNLILDKKMLELSYKKNPTVIYISFSKYFNKTDYYNWRKQIKSLGANRVSHIAIDKINSKNKHIVFNNDIIYLSGGNTFTFLNNIKRLKLQTEFKKYIKRGGVLAGMSAGSILMTKTINMAQIPYETKDDNYVKLKNLKSLSFVDFEFSPHYEFNENHDLELSYYSKLKRKTVYAVKDGAGIIINGKSKLYHGSIYKFINGRKKQVSQEL